ncbi:hypothetical protein V5E97_31140 [Singulisphaera sp. Ch08]|uniref:DSBA-like thioredoxin domain-containing protein n=1 Tax=Singulisphaera sp. Ch08 TaxID=3120278 RepID=A0AAU7CC67_9BACT
MLTIDVISDVICPWYFIGKRRLEKAFEGRTASDRWHPFQPGSQASGAFRMRWRRPYSWLTSPTAATCPTGRRWPR